MASTTEQYSAAANGAGGAVEKIADFWTQGAQGQRALRGPDQGRAERTCWTSVTCPRPATTTSSSSAWSRQTASNKLPVSSH